MAPPSMSTQEPTEKESFERRSLAMGQLLAHPEPGEEIVIAGLSGSYPNSLNVYDFRDNLYNKIDLVSTVNTRWFFDHPEIPDRGGRIYNIEKFDASFFGVHFKQAHSMDPMGRLLLEKTFEAVIDAGLNPKEIRGTKTGVFIGVCFSESEKTWFYEQAHPNRFAVTGCVRAMLANRISYWLGVDGPSYTIDTACSSSLYALEHAYRALRTGQCDMAIVGGCNLCLHPYVTLQFARLGVLNKDGHCKCFDENADGYTRAEAVVVTVLQRSKDAKRIYARVVHAKTNCDGYKEQGITYPSGVMQTALLKEFYEECGVNPNEIHFVEAHGTGTKVGDPEEVGAIEGIFCGKDRKSTLMIGSVKCNIGHSEPASGLCSVTKALLIMENGYLIPNINFNKPRPEMKALNDGRMKVVTEKTKFIGEYIAVSSFGFGGANCHTLLQMISKPKINQGQPKDDIPRLVYISGRTEDAINSIFDDMQTRPLDAEFVGLMHEIYKYDIPAHLYRGYLVMTKNSIVHRELSYYSYEEMPLWYIFSGLGSQWLGMGASLMKIPMFAASIEKMHQIISSKGISISDIITKNDPTLHSKQVNILVGITAMQIAIVDLLRAVDLQPVGIIGYSIGNLACAYYDGCLTLEQAILCAYYLGQAADKAKNAVGLMVSVDANLEKVKKLLVPGVEVAIVNSENNCVVSGSTQSVKEFIKKLNDVKYTEIDTQNVAFHSSYAKEIATSVLKHIKQIIPTPKQRSEKCITHDNKSSNICSAEFISNILTSGINFEEIQNSIPNMAVTFEISPHGLLQGVIKNTDLDDCVNIALLKKGEDGAEHLFAAIGKLYLTGYNPRVEKIYPKIQFPVSRGTPMLSPLIKWDHSQDWFVTKFEVQDKIKSGERSVLVKLNDDELSFIAGHQIDGRILYPATGYLTLVWETLGMVRGQLYTQLPIVFENVKFHRATHLHKDSRMHFLVVIQKASGNFEIIEGGTAVVTGTAYIPDDIKKDSLELPVPIPEKKDYYRELNSRDIYKELRLRGYNYSGLFRGLQSCDPTATVGKVYWKNNWIAYMDTILQMQILHVDTRGLFVPTAIESLKIDIEKHTKLIEAQSEEENILIPVYAYPYIKTLVCGGVEIRGLEASAISRRKILGEPVLETYKFVPNTLKTNEYSLEQSIRVMFHIILDNFITLNKIRTVEALEDNAPEDEKILTNIIIDALADLPLRTPDCNILTNKALEINGVTVSDKKLVSETNHVLVMVSNVFQRPTVLQAALNALVKGGFVIARENLDVNLSEVDLTKINIIADHTIKNERLILFNKTSEITMSNFVDVTDTEYKFEWVPTLQNILKTDQSVIVVAQGEYTNGIIGFVNCLRREPGNENVKCVFIMDKDAPKFDLNNEFYVKQLRKGLALNILKDKEWGTYRHMLVEPVKTVETEHAYVNITVRGDLSSLKWLEGPLSSNLDIDSNKILVHVYYSAMNFRDIMTATGRIAPEVVSKGRFQQDCVQGLEFCGKLSNGQRVLGMVSHLAMASLVTADPSLLWPIPDKWTMEEAVTIPVVYGTVLYGFVIEGKIQRGMSVLIHSGTGGVGQAAINIALFYGCTVFTTVGTEEKREFIKRKWPQIKDSHIGNSRDLSFEQMVLCETNGRGVDLVLNSLAEEKLLASVRCLARYGKFLEIGKFDLSKDNPLPLAMFHKEASFHGVMLDTFFRTANQKKKLIFNLVTEGIKSGAIKPLERCVFQPDQVEEMFRFMGSGKHMGKVILKIRDEEPQLHIPPKKFTMIAHPRYFSQGLGSYIVTGGLGGFGLELVDWLILRGVKKLVITSRKGISTGYQSLRIKIWKSYGVDIIISTEDITTYEGCEAVIRQALDLGPVEAIFNLAVVLKDAMFENQTVEDFETSFKPKAIATKYLDAISRDLCPDLKQFVIFSSVSCGRGNPGQTNYGMANSVMERICEKRQQNGLPALAVEWGAVGDVGLVAEMQEEHTELVIGGTLQQKISNCLTILDQFLRQNQPIVSSMLVAEKRSGDGAAGNIIDAVVNILGIRDIKTVSAHSSLAELGMDSIMAVEIKQTLEREFEVFLTPQDIRSMTFARLHEIAAEQQAKPTEDPDADSKMDVTDDAIKFMFRAISDEDSANESVIVLPSKSTEECKDRVILISGVEGMASLLETLASHLIVRPYCLQIKYNADFETIQDMANILIDLALDTFPDIEKTGFTIVGYSYGCAVALELAALLEAKGYNGRIICIDGAPVMLKSMAQQQIPCETDEMLQNSVIYNIVSFFTANQESVNLLQSEYEKCTTFDEKVEIVLKYRPGDNIYSEEHYKNACIFMYRRIKAMLNYTPTIGKLRSKIKLIKPREHTVIMDAEDFELSNYSEQSIEVIYVDGNHVLIIENPECANEINDLFKRETISMKESVITKIDDVKQQSVKI